MIGIIDYGMGNAGSIFNMLRKCGHEAVITHDHREIGSADKLILPGVGAFDHGMKMLRQSGLDELLRRRVLDECVPILGVCLGVQLFAKSSEEGIEHGLGWVDANVVRFGKGRPDFDLKVPHMGWNEVEIAGESPIFEGIDGDARFYFVHSYHLECRDDSDVCALSNYGYRFVAAISRKNIYGTQFHPEKSHKYGLKVLKNFVDNS